MHHETNLHNLMGNKPRHWLDQCASLGTIVGFIVLPVLARLRGWTHKPGHWVYYLLPRAELMTNVVLAQLCQSLYNMRALNEDYVQFRLGWNEIREYYWGVLALMYILIMWERLITSQRAGASDTQVHQPGGQARPTLQAA